jgi:hypothetical protein
MGTLAAALGATACKEEDPDPPPSNNDSGMPGGGDSGMPGGGDSGMPGGGDAGPGGDGGMDAGPPTVMCGGQVCTSHTFAINGTVLAAGCARNHVDAEVCGISSSLLGDAGLPEFLEKNPPSKISVPCADYIDEREVTPDGGAGDGGSKKGNHLIDVIRSNLPFEYPGCCTAAGFCSAEISMGKLNGQLEANTGYGCLRPEIFLASQPAFMDVQSRFIACDPVTGDLRDAGAASGDAGGDAGADAGDGG